jgi:hypothetical protein
MQGFPATSLTIMVMGQRSHQCWQLSALMHAAQVVDGQSIVRVPESVLSQGIEWCINNHIRLVNISYSIEEVHYS